MLKVCIAHTFLYFLTYIPAYYICLLRVALNQNGWYKKMRFLHNPVAFLWKCNYINLQTDNGATSGSLNVSLLSWPKRPWPRCQNQEINYSKKRQLQNNKPLIKLMDKSYLKQSKWDPGHEHICISHTGGIYSVVWYPSWDSLSFIHFNLWISHDSWSDANIRSKIRTMK